MLFISLHVSSSVLSGRFRSASSVVDSNGTVPSSGGQVGRTSEIDSTANSGAVVERKDSSECELQPSFSTTSFLFRFSNFSFSLEQSVSSHIS